MKKTAMALFIYLSFSSFILKGQDSLRSKHFVGVFGGLSWLNGNLAKNVYSDPTSGFARNPANNFGIEGACYLNRYIGIGGLFSFWEFSANSNNLARGIQESYGTNFGGATIDIYKTFNVFVGPYISYPLTRQISIDYRLLGGLTNATLPQINLQLCDQNDAGNPVTYNIYTQNKSVSDAFGFQTGIGVRLNVYKGISLTIRGDYYYSNPYFKVVNAPSTVQNQSPTLRQPIVSYHQPFSGFAVSAGLSFQFGKNK